MLLRTDPFRELREPLGLFGPLTRPAPMPVDVYRKDDSYLVQIDIPGVHPESIDVSVRKNVVTVTAQPTRADESSLEVLLSERPQGAMTRHLALGEDIDAERVQADYVNGVLMLHLPIAAHARPQKVTVRAASTKEQLTV
jgi:HSP20 family protein